MPRIAYGKPAAAGMTIQETKKLVDDYANEMKDIYGSHMNVKDLAEYMGCHRETAEKELRKAKEAYAKRSSEKGRNIRQLLQLYRNRRERESPTG